MSRWLNRRRTLYRPHLAGGLALIVALSTAGQGAAQSGSADRQPQRVAQSDSRNQLSNLANQATEPFNNATGPALVPAASDLTGGENLPAPATPNQSTSRGFTIPLATADGQDAINITSNDGLVSLVVRDAPLRHVMALLADAHQLSLVFASSTDVPVTATLDRVPLNRAIDALLTANGFTWTQTDQVIYVTNIAESAGLPAGVQGRRIAVLELDFASAADIDQGVKGLLSPIGKSWVLESSDSDNRRTKEAIVVEDIKANLDRIERFVSEADQPPRQVLIEAHLLEVELDRDERAGVNLSGLARISGSQLTAAAAGLANPTASPAFLIENTGGDLGLLVEALISTNDAKTLAKPRVLAVNGQQARIQIGERFGFRVTTTTQTSTQESVEFLDVGVVLSVTPRITRDGRVLMRIKPEVSSGVVNPISGLPEEETTEIETDVLLANGQGMVIGGLIQERDDTAISRVPFLSKIPYAGFLFERRQDIKERSELIIALKPHILPYSPIEQCRNDEQFARTAEPLLHGALCRNPRPYEPRLPGTVSPTNRPPRCNHQEGCYACNPATCDATVHEGTLSQSPKIRRLPPIDAPTQVTNRPIPRLVY